MSAKTFMQKPAEITRKWYLIDAAGQPMGRTAAMAAHILRGKHKVTFAPNADCGDFVVIINAEKALLTGNKLMKKFHRWHTGYIGHLKEIRYDRLMDTKPEKAMMLAVSGMVPDTVIGRKALTRVRIYRGENHAHTAQKPETLEIRRKV